MGAKSRIIHRMRNPIAQRRSRILRNNSTDAERFLWQHLRDRQIDGYRFRRQVPIGGYIADFACLDAKLVIELDGGQHQETRAYDERRARRIETHGYRIIRFWDTEVFKETTAVLEATKRELEPACPHPSLPPQAEEGI